MAKLKSLLKSGRYTPAWIKDFYNQAGIWWGGESEVPEEDLARAASIERLCGAGRKRVLELGCGAGHTAAATADLGHNVVAIDLSPRRIQQAKELLKKPSPGSLTFLEADFYEIELKERFDVVCYWDGFGVGSDAEHRRLFRRIVQEWLAPGGCVLMDVASTAWAVRHAGLEERLAPLDGVPGSVEMIRRYHFDAVHCRWIDEWQPAAHPEKTLAQTIRCYTPVDFLLLLEGTGLILERIEVGKQVIDIQDNRIMTGEPMIEAYSFLIKLVLKDDLAKKTQPPAIL
jgi:SAM-dependent methyltransferase